MSLANSAGIAIGPDYALDLTRPGLALYGGVPRAELAGVIGQCPEMLEVFSTIRRVASSDASILIAGESGTGKEMISRAIHSMSLRKDYPFIAINCGAIPEHLLESELFGHERGAFTCAHAQVQGRFEYANKGTLFLDEIGELSLSLQVKLLRFLQEKIIQRVGGSKQKQSLVKEFRSLLVRTYATSLTAFSNQDIEFKPFSMKPEDTEVTVQTEVKQPGGKPVPIDYSMYKTAFGWKVYDVAIDGVSLVINYRSSFASTIRQSGMDGLINTLEKKSKNLESSGSKPGNGTNSVDPAKATKPLPKKPANAKPSALMRSVAVAALT